MKIVLKILNLFIIALAALATVFLFTQPTISLNSKVCLDLASFAKFVPTTPYTDDLDLPTLLGTDEIQVGIKFTLNTGDTARLMSNDKDFVNEDLIGPNINDIAAIIHDPVVLVTEYSVRSFLKGLIKDEITTQIEAARQKYGDTGSTTEDIMNEVGMDDEYFDNFTYSLYTAADAEDATVDSVTEVLYTQIDDALAKAEESGMVDTSGYTEDSKATLRDDVIANLNEMYLVNEDNTVNRISQMSFVYLSKYLADELNGKVDDAELAKKADEDYYLYSTRLLRLFIYNQIPADVYTAMSYVAMGLFVAIFIFAANWVILILITLFRTLIGKKPWTIFGPWFWFIGGLQIVLGFLLTYLGKITLPSLNIYSYLATLNIPIKSIILAPRTFALLPSILYLVCIPLSIVYLIIKNIVKRQINNEN